MSEQPLVHTTVDARIAVLTIDHPPANALSLAVLEALQGALSAALANPEVKVIILTGAGRFFSAGADMTVTARGPLPTGGRRCATPSPMPKSR